MHWDLCHPACARADAHVKAPREHWSCMSMSKAVVPLRQALDSSWHCRHCGHPVSLALVPRSTMGIRSWAWMMDLVHAAGV